MIYAKFIIYPDWENTKQWQCHIESFVKIDSIGNVFFIKNDSIFSAKISSDSLKQFFKFECSILPDSFKRPEERGDCGSRYCFLNYYSKHRKQNEFIFGEFDQPEFLHFLLHYLDDSKFYATSQFRNKNDSVKIIQDFLLKKMKQHIPFPPPPIKQPIKFTPPVIKN